DVKYRPGAGEIFAQRSPSPFGMGPRAGGRVVVATPRIEPRHATLRRVDPEPIGQLLEIRRPGPEAAEEALRQPRRRFGLEELSEHRVDPIHVAIPPALASRSPCLARADF